MVKINLGWYDIDNAACDIVERLKGNFEPEVIVAIGRGGWIPSIIISNELNIKHIYNFSVSTYNDNDVKDGTFRIFQTLPSLAIYKKRVLIVDDISDTGETLAYISERVASRQPTVYKVAALFKKPHTKYIPDYFSQEYPNDVWIQFPWET